MSWNYVGALHVGGRSAVGGARSGDLFPDRSYQVGSELVLLLRSELAAASSAACCREFDCESGIRSPDSGSRNKSVRL